MKARCFYYILDQTKKALETEEIAAHVTELGLGTDSDDVAYRGLETAHRRSKCYAVSVRT